MKNKMPISAGELYVILDREFRMRHSRECKSCYILLPYRVDSRDDGDGNWEIVIPPECPYGCSAVLEELLTPLVAARDSALERDGSLATFLHEAARMQAAYQGLIDAQLYQPLSGRCANSCEIRPRRSSPRSPSAPTPTGRCARISTPRIC